MKTYLLLFAFMGLLFSFTECERRLSVKIESKEIAMLKKDSTVIIRQQYRISIPAFFSIKNGNGDDTEFFEAVSPDQQLLIFYETGPGAKKKSITKFMERATVKTILIKKLNSSYLKLSYIDTGNTFRQLEGIVFLENKANSERTPLFDFSVKRERLHNIIAISKTVTNH